MPVVLALLLAGCGGGGAADDPASRAVPPTPSETATPEISRVPPNSPSPTGSDPGQRGMFTTATGVVDAIGDGCVYVLVDGTAERWALRGQVPAVSEGDRVEVSGAPDDTSYEECPDGLPFLVDEVSAAG